MLHPYTYVNIERTCIVVLGEAMSLNTRKQDPPLARTPTTRARTHTDWPACGQVGVDNYYNLDLLVENVNVDVRVQV